MDVKEIKYKKLKREQNNSLNLEKQYQANSNF